MTCSEVQPGSQVTLGKESRNSPVLFTYLLPLQIFIRWMETLNKITIWDLHFPSFLCFWFWTLKIGRQPCWLKCSLCWGYLHWEINGSGLIRLNSAILAQNTHAGDKEHRILLTALGSLCFQNVFFNSWIWLRYQDWEGHWQPQWLAIGDFWG